MQNEIPVALISFKGLPVYAIQLANGLANLTEIHLFLADIAIKTYAPFIDSRIHLHQLRTYRYRNPAGILASLNIIHKIKTAGIQIAHLIANEPWFNLFIPFIKSFSLVTTVHDVRYHPGDRRSNVVPQAVSDLATKFSTALIVHGIHLKTSLCVNFRIDKNRVFVIPHMNYSFYRSWERAEIKEEENNILFFGSIWEYKGLKYLMKAEPFLSRELGHFKIIIAGAGEPFSKYRKYVCDRSKYEIINEFIPDERVAELFQRAAVVVLPYIEASQSGVIPLAFSFGKPVVATSVGSIPEIVDNGKNGFLVNPRDPYALGEAVVKILCNAELRNTMSKNARIKAYQELSWNRVARIHLEVYRKILHRFPKAP